jgi:hypothetical protein
MSLYAMLRTVFEALQENYCASNTVFMPTVQQVSAPGGVAMSLPALRV